MAGESDDDGERGGSDDERGGDDAGEDGLPPLVWDREDELVRLFDAAPGLLFCSDFDGTLTAIVDDPDAPEMRPGCADALRRLRDRENVRVALVSGRELADLRGRADIDGVGYAGNHGLEMVPLTDAEGELEMGDGDAPAETRDDGVTVHPAAADRAEDIEHVASEVREGLDVDGLHVEEKGVTATVHYRNAPDDRVDEIRAAVEEAVEGVGDDRLRVSEGKAIVEIGPKVPWDKGKAVELFADEVPDSWLVVYVGDDTTDEHAFRSIDPDGLSIHVGDDPDTDARYRLRDPEDVERFLDWVNDRLDDSQ